MFTVFVAGILLTNEPCYDVESVSINKEPIISHLAGNSDFGFA